MSNQKKSRNCIPRKDKDQPSPDVKRHAPRDNRQQ
jgi:hypothetical protein